jgi:hypothetical protein
MPPLAIEFDGVGLMALATLYIVVGLPLGWVFVSTTAASMREYRARQQKYPDTLKPDTLSDYVDPGIIAFGVACWLLIGFLIWFAVALCACGLSGDPYCNPMQYFPIRVVLIE